MSGFERHASMRLVSKLVDAVLGVGDATAMLEVRSRDSVGVLFLEKGRLCWAAVPETRRYLTARLQERARATPEQMSAFIQEAQATKRPLGELLVAKSLLSENGLRAALREHSLESAAVMASSEVEGITVHTRTSVGFDSRFTFELLPFFIECLERVVTVPKLSVKPPAGDGFTGLVVMVDGGVPLPVRTIGATPSLERAVALARDGHRWMEQVGAGTAAMHCGERCWSVSGSPDMFLVCEGSTPLSFVWMASQPNFGRP